MASPVAPASLSCYHFSLPSVSFHFLLHTLPRKDQSPPAPLPFPKLTSSQMSSFHSAPGNCIPSSIGCLPLEGSVLWSAPTALPGCQSPPQQRLLLSPIAPGHWTRSLLPGAASTQCFCYWCSKVSCCKLTSTVHSHHSLLFCLLLPNHCLPSLHFHLVKAQT